MTRVTAPVGGGGGGSEVTEPSGSMRGTGVSPWHSHPPVDTTPPHGAAAQNSGKEKIPRQKDLHGPTPPL